MNICEGCKSPSSEALVNYCEKCIIYKNDNVFYFGGHKKYPSKGEIGDKVILFITKNKIMLESDKIVEKFEIRINVKDIKEIIVKKRKDIKRDNTSDSSGILFGLGGLLGVWIVKKLTENNKIIVIKYTEKHNSKVVMFRITDKYERDKTLQILNNLLKKR